MAGRPWFGPKRYGWGLTPISWQGWALTGAYVVAVFVLATVAFFLIAFLTRRTG